MRAPTRPQIAGIGSLVDSQVSASVAVRHWNPVRPLLHDRFGRRLPVRRPVRNFGDMLGPAIVARLMERQALKDTGRIDRPGLVSVGSVLHLAGPGDTVWGSGVNEKMRVQWLSGGALDVRAVRGPSSRAVLLERGIDCPQVYGDPALLLPQLFPEIVRDLEPRFDVTVLPNLHDWKRHRGHPAAFSPRRPWREVMRRIARSRRVVASSLHGIVLAESLGVPVVRFAATLEPDFKYDDYYLGTGRAPKRPLPDLESALAAEAEEPDLSFDTARLLAAFPSDLWSI